MDEDDIATYTIKTIDDPRTLNKTLHLRPPESIVTQRQLVEIWESLVGKKLERVSLSKQDFLASIKGREFGFTLVNLPKIILVVICKRPAIACTGFAKFWAE
jgi:hypothetical protein